MRGYTLKIEDADDIKYWRVSLMAATEMTFDIKIKDYDKTLRDICRVVPNLANFDADLRQACDDAFRTEFHPQDIRKVTKFVKKNDFINVDCDVFLLLGFEGETIDREPEVYEDENE